MQQTSELGISLRPGFDIAVVCAVQLCTIAFSGPIFSSENLGQNQLKTCSKYHLVGLLNEKQASTFATFYTFPNPTDPLN